MTKKSNAGCVYLLHQVHDALEVAVFICCTLFLPLKVGADLSHDFGLLLIALVVLLTEAWLVGIQPFWVL